MPYSLLGLCCLSYVIGVEYAMEFSAINKSTVLIGKVQEQLDGCSNCRACNVPSNLCYPELDPRLYTVNFTNLVMPRSTITLETWVRFDELNSTINLISATDGVEEFRNLPDGFGGFRLGFFRDFPTFGVAVGVTSDGLPDQDLMSVSGPPSSNWVLRRWYHLAGTWDGEYRKLYVDGELMDAYKPPYSASYNIRYSTAQFALGASSHCLIQVLFSGALAEVRMWNVSRTEAEIKALMNSRAVGNEHGLIGLWREVSGGTVQDVSGHQPPASATAVNNVVIPFPPSLFQSNSSWTTRNPCKTYTGSFCEQLIDYPYFAPNNTWQWRTEATVGNLGVLKNVASPACYTALVKHLCGLWYPRCLLRNVTQVHQPDPTVTYPPPLTLQTWVPMPVDSESCSNIANVCRVEMATLFAASITNVFFRAAYQQGTPDPRFNNSECLGTWYLGVYENGTRGRVFPARNATNHTYGPFDFTEPFVASSAVLNPDLPSCEYPFVLRETFSEEMQAQFIAQFLNLSDLPVELFSDSPYCTTQCPPAIMKPTEYLTYSRVTGGLAMISFLFSSFILIMILRDPHKRRFPGNLTALILGSVAGLSFALALSVFGNWDDYFCLRMHNVQASQGDDALCDTQSVFIQFFLALTQGYWCSMCAFLHTVLKLKPSSNWIPFSILPPLFALLSVIILASAGKMGLASSGNICWVKSGESGFSWGLYYAPGLLNVLFSIYILALYAHNRKGFKTDAAFFRMLHITMLLFIAAIFSMAAASNISAQYPQFIYNSGVYLRCRTLALAYGLYRDLHDPSLRNVQQNLDRARAVGGFDVSGDPNSCPSYDPGFNLGVFYVDQLVLAGLGTLIPIILLAKHAKKIFAIERWSSTKTTANSVHMRSTSGGSTMMSTSE